MKSLGQIAYESVRGNEGFGWETLTLSTQQIWENAAEAVVAANYERQRAVADAMLAEAGQEFLEGMEGE